MRLRLDKIMLSTEDVTEIHKWANANDVSIDVNIPFEKVALVLGDESYTLKCYNKNTYVNIFIIIDKVNRGYFRFNRSNLKIIKNEIVGREVITEKHLQAMIMQYLYTMAYITEYKPVLEPKEVSKSKKKHKRSYKTENSITYLFNRHYITNHSTTPKKHRPCKYAYTVRGHFRHLRNGKKIWVSQYIKGKGKLREKIIKIN